MDILEIRKDPAVEAKRARAHRRYRDSRAAEADASHADVIRMVKAGIKQADIARYKGWHRSRVSHIVKRARERGML